MAKKEEVIPPSYRVYIDTSQLFNTEGQDSFNVDGNQGGLETEFVNQIMTSVPEDGVNMTTASNFEAPLSEGADSLNTFFQLANVDTTNKLKSFSKQVWQGSDPLEIDLSMELVTVEEPYKEVVRPALTMLAVPLPVGTKGTERWTLGSPVLAGERGLAVKISRMNFPFVYPLNVDVSWNKTYCRDPNTGGAWPVSAEVQFSFLATPLPTRRDLGFVLEGAGASIGEGEDEGLTDLESTIDFD